MNSKEHLVIHLWDGWVESDDVNDMGVVDRSSFVSGTFKSNGLATVSVDAWENPSHTLIFTEFFDGTASEDIDKNNDGTADNLLKFGDIYDAIGVPDSAGDKRFLYAAQLGGTNFKYIGSDPRLIYRDGITDKLNAIHNATDQIFDSNGVEYNWEGFDKDPRAGITFGEKNPVRN